MARLRAIPLHLCWFLLIGALAGVSTLAFGPGWSFLVVAILSLPALALVPEGYRRVTHRTAELHWLALLLSIVTLLGVTRYLPDLPTLLRSPTVAVARASELPPHGDAVNCAFGDAIVRTDLAHERRVRTHDERRGGTWTRAYVVAPITDAGWTKDQPVTAWATCDGEDARDGRCEHWGRENAQAVEAFRDAAGELQRAIRDAAEAQGLVLVEPVRAVLWVPDAQAEIHRRAWMLGLSVLGAWLLFELLAAAGRWISHRVASDRSGP